jgi:type IV pilus assembly protein PilN
VILINLLPHREERRRQRKRAYFAALGGCVVLGLLIAGVWYGVLQHLTSVQQERNQFLQSEIKQLEAQIKDIATLRAEIDALKARQKAVEDLQTDRNAPVYLLDELSRQMPEGVYLTSVKQSGQVVQITGLAQTNERVSELLRNTLYNSPWLERPELVEIKSVMVATGAQRELRRMNEFAMRLTLKRPQAPAAASAPAGAASAAPPAAPNKST